MVEPLRHRQTKGAATDMPARAALFERHTETFELFPLEADPSAELETAAGDHIDGGNLLGEAYGIVKRDQEHAGYDADPVGAGSDRRGYGQDRGQIPVFDEVVLGQPDIIKAVVLAPRDLIEDFAVEPVGGLAPLWRISEVVPKTKAYFSTVLKSCLASPGRFGAPPWTAGRTHSDLSRAAVHEQLDAGDVGTVVGSKEYRRLAQIVRNCEAAERNGGDGRCFFLFRHELGEARCICVSGAQHVDADVAPLEIDDPGTQTSDCGF